MEENVKEVIEYLEKIVEGAKAVIKEEEAYDELCIEARAEYGLAKRILSMFDKG